MTAEEEEADGLLKQEGKGDGSEKAKGCKERCMRKTQRRERREKVGTGDQSLTDEGGVEGERRQKE